MFSLSAQDTRACTPHAAQRAGRSTLVVEAQTLGHGASSRNGGQISTSIKPDKAALTPDLRKRIIPIGSYIIATEALPKPVMDHLTPMNRILSDTHKLVYCYRPPPDRQRILFGERVSLSETAPRATKPLPQDELIRLFPDLADVKISHSWSGFVGYTFDSLMHIGRNDGAHSAMGYCGSGVGMASYLGMKLGLMAVDDPAGETALAKLPFPGRAYYRGTPWFLKPSIAAYRLRDRLGF